MQTNHEIGLEMEAKPSYANESVFLRENKIHRRKKVCVCTYNLGRYMHLRMMEIIRICTYAIGLERKNNNNKKCDACTDWYNVTSTGYTGELSQAAPIQTRS